MKIKIITGALALAMTFVACANEETETTESEGTTTEVSHEEETVVEKDEVVETTIETETEIVSKYQYDKDWEIIKEAILDQDIAGLGAWAGSDDFDAEMFIMMAQEDWVIEALNNTSYDDLQVEDMEDGVYLVFYAEITGTDDEGYEVGSSLMLYMSQGDPSLMVEYFMAAG